MLATLLVLIDAVFGDRGFEASVRARRDYDAARAALVGVQQANAGLREQARRLSGDAAAIENVARKELGLIRPGEVLFFVKGKTVP